MTFRPYERERGPPRAPPWISRSLAEHSPHTRRSLAEANFFNIFSSRRRRALAWLRTRSGAARPGTSLGRSLAARASPRRRVTVGCVAIAGVLLCITAASWTVGGACRRRKEKISKKSARRVIGECSASVRIVIGPLLTVGCGAWSVEHGRKVIETHRNSSKLCF